MHQHSICIRLLDRDIEGREKTIIQSGANDKANKNKKVEEIGSMQRGLRADRGVARGSSSRIRTHHLFGSENVGCMAIRRVLDLVPI